MYIAELANSEQKITIENIMCDESRLDRCSVDQMNFRLRENLNVRLEEGTVSNQSMAAVVNDYDELD